MMSIGMQTFGHALDGAALGGRRPDRGGGLFGCKALVDVPGWGCVQQPLAQFALGSGRPFDGASAPPATRR